MADAACDGSQSSFPLHVLPPTSALRRSGPLFCSDLPCGLDAITGPLGSDSDDAVWLAPAPTPPLPAFVSVRLSRCCGRCSRDRGLSFFSYTLALINTHTVHTGYLVPHTPQEPALPVPLSGERTSTGVHTHPECAAHLRQGHARLQHQTFHESIRQDGHVQGWALS